MHYFMAVLLAIFLLGCGDDGSNGTNCWDVNNNGVFDTNEDVNGDGVAGIEDCSIAAMNGDELCAVFRGKGLNLEGCPTTKSIAAKPAPLRQVLWSDFGAVGDNYATNAAGTCDLSTEDINLTVIARLNNKSTSAATTYAAYYNFNGTYKADREQFAYDTGECEQKCNNDTFCVGYLALYDGQASDQCDTLHKTNNSGSILGYEILCGVGSTAAAATASCQSTIGNFRWGAHCP
jgi:hypothetical protein